MFVETLLVFSCSSTPEACSPIARAYYASHPEIGQYAKRMQRTIMREGGPVLQYMLPIVGLAAGRTSYQFRITEGVRLRLEEDSAILNLTFDF